MANNSLPPTQNTNLLFSSKKYSKRRKWTDDETKLLLKCFMPRQHEFLSRKKIFAYKLVLNDMFAQGFQDKSVTQSSLENKMKTLYRAYKTYKDNFPAKASNRIAPFLEELESIFTEQPDTFIQPTSDKTEKNKFIKLESAPFDDYEIDSFTQSDSDDPLQDEKNAEKQEINTTDSTTFIKQDPNLFENLTTNSSKLNGNTNAQHEYYEAKLEFKRRALAMKAKFYGEMKELFKEKFQREEAMERQKLDLLAKIAEKLCKP